MTTDFTLHAVLIGIDAYPPPNELAGCVNDIDAIESLLLDAPGIGVPPEQIQVQRLTLAKPSAPPKTRFAAQNQIPTRENIIKTLEDLAASDLQTNDRVLIYYSGHGYAKRADGTTTWVESLVASSPTKPALLYDYEVNKLVSAIAAKTDHLTVILDCCHAGGATRDEDTPNAKSRLFQATADLDTPAFAPDATRSLDDSGGLFPTADPDYLVVAACQRDEKANEGQEAGETRHGFLTAALLAALKDRSAEDRARLRWADLWPPLLDAIDARVVRMRRTAQHPWLLGHAARRIFGGDWQPMDPGLTVQRQGDGFVIGAGTLMGITEGAELAVYGQEPRFFSELNDPAVAAQFPPVGRLRVKSATNASALAEAQGIAFELPEGGRARLIRPGTTGRLRVHLKPIVTTTELATAIAQSPLLEVVTEPLPRAEAEVDLRDGRWAIGNDVEPYLAFVDTDHMAGLLAGLDHLYHVQAVLRMAQRLADPSASQLLRVRILACPQPIDPKDASKLEEVGRDPDNIYHVRPGDGVVFEVKNTTTKTLHFAVFNVGHSGAVAHLTKETLAPNDRFYVYSGNNLGRPLRPSQPKIQPGPGRTFVTDRLVVIGTDSRTLNLEGLAVRQSVQAVVDATPRDLTLRDFEEEATPGAPAETWTATVTPWRTEVA